MAQAPHTEELDEHFKDIVQALHHLFLRHAVRNELYGIGCSRQGSYLAALVASVTAVLTLQNLRQRSRISAFQ